MLVFDGELRGWVAGPGPLGTTGPVVTRDRWICVEMHVAIGLEGRLRIWLDEALALDSGVVDTQQASGYDKILVGLPWTSDDQLSAVTFADDVIIAESPIGCSP